MNGFVNLAGKEAIPFFRQKSSIRPPSHGTMTEKLWATTDDRTTRQNHSRTTTTMGYRSHHSSWTRQPTLPYVVHVRNYPTATTSTLGVGQSLPAELLAVLARADNFEIRFYKEIPLLRCSGRLSLLLCRIRHTGALEGRLLMTARV